MNKNRRIVIGSLLFGLASPSRRVQRLLRNTRQPLRTPRPNPLDHKFCSPNKIKRKNSCFFKHSRWFELSVRFSDRLRQRLASTGVLETAKKLHLRVLTQALLMLLTVLALPNNVSGQGLELHGGYVHVTQNFGTNGFNVGAAWWFTKRVTIAADYDSAWNTSTIGTFAITPVGTLVSKAHLQNLLFGPRIFFPYDRIEKYRLNPFAEAQFGVSHIKTTFNQVVVPASVSSSDTAFSWMIGGGVEYLFDPHWSGRANLDFLRTHFADQGQSRFRLVLGVTYTFGGREFRPKPPKEKK